MVTSSTQKLYSSGRTVYSVAELSFIWGISNPNVLKNKVRYWVKSGKLLRLKRGLYALTPNYSAYEVAQKLLTPSYISLHTVLFMEGVVFQYDSGIYSVASLSRTYDLGNRIYSYKKVKDSVLYNANGVNDGGGYHIASKERAFLDQLYLVPNYYFDNLDSMDWDKVLQILPIYDVISLERTVRAYVR